MNICLYGASSDNINDNFKKKAFALGSLIAKRGHSLVYGAGANGLMGATAKGVHSENGEIIGISPSFFNVDGILFDKCTKLITTDTMRERKKLMEDLADAFVVAPGGIGTFDEFFEIYTLKQLNRHNKPLVLFNIDGFYNPFLQMLKHTADNGFMNNETLNLFKVFNDENDIIDYIENYNEKEIEISKLKNI